MRTNHQTSGISRSAFLRGLALSVPLLPGTMLCAQTEPPPNPVDSQPDLGNLRALVELARSDVRTEKSWIIAQNLPFTEEEAEAFWPLHREYDLEYTKLLDRRYNLIVQFARQYGTMTDAQATELAEKTFELESKRTALKKEYFKKFSKVIPALKAARFFQLENQINMVLDLKVAASLPLLQ